MVSILSSPLLVFIISLIWLLFPIIKNTFYKKKHTIEDITFYIIKAMLYFSLPRLLLIKKDLHTVMLRSVHDMIERTKDAFTTELLYINYFIVLYIVGLNIWLYIRNGKSFNINLIVRDKWYYIIILMNIGFFNLSMTISDIMYAFIFINFILFSKFSKVFIKKIINEILLLYIYLSFLIILLKPKAAILSDGTWAGIFENPNSLVVIVNFILILLLLLPFFSKTTIWRYINIALLFYIIIMSGSRNGLLTFLLIILLYIIIYNKLHYMYILLLFIILPGLFWFYDIYSNLNFREITSDRSIAWAYLVSKLKGNYIFGLGYNYFSEVSRIKNFPKYLFSLTNAMNIYLEYLVRYGILGFFVLISFTVSLYNRVKQINPVLLVFVVLLVLPNMFESFFKPPNLSINNILYLLMIFIINNSWKYLRRKNLKINFNEKHSSIINLPQQKR